MGLYWKYETWIRQRLSDIDSIFGATGPCYCIRRSLTKPIPPDILLDDVYLPLGAFFQGYRLVVEPRAVAFDYPTSLDSEFKRKVRTLAGNYQILSPYPGLLGPANRMWFHFVSYKLGRLLLPYFLILVLVASIWLPRPYAAELLLPQAAFYGIAAIDPLIPRGWMIKRVSSPARSFVVLVFAALLAISVFFVPPRTLWKETKVAAPHR